MSQVDSTVIRQAAVDSPDAAVSSECRLVTGGSPKIQTWHQERLAVVYVRQSTPQQVIEHRESTELQYELARRACDLSWLQDRVLIIDEDQGQTARSAVGRQGFQRLLAEVSLDHVGLVLGIEMSRLARSCKDWHQLLEVCALFQTLLADQDGVYDPNNYNDRLLLGLKGTMSEAELHVLRTRLQGGIESKARRGELKTRLPMGLVYDDHDRVVFDPDRQVQQALMTFFDVFRRQGTACAIIKHFHKEGLLFPRRIRVGVRKGDLVWVRLSSKQALTTLHKQRFMQVDPNNRLVADALEADWNQRLRALSDAQEIYEKDRQADRAVLDEKQRQQVLSLTKDFPRLWRDPKVSHRERKRMVRLLIEDVTLLKGEQISIGVCFRGGATCKLMIPVPLPSCYSWQTPPEIVARIDRLLDQHTDGEIAAQLNQQGLRSGKGGCFTRITIENIRRSYRLKSRHDRLLETGMLTVREIAKQLDISTSTAYTWRQLGILKAQAYSDKNECLFEPLSGPKPVAWRGKKLSHPQRFGKVLSETTKEV